MICEVQLRRTRRRSLLYRRVHGAHDATVVSRGLICAGRDALNAGQDVVARTRETVRRVLLDLPGLDERTRRRRRRKGR